MDATWEKLYEELRKVLPDKPLVEFLQEMTGVAAYAKHMDASESAVVIFKI